MNAAPAPKKENNIKRNLRRHQVGARPPPGHPRHQGGARYAGARRLGAARVVFFFSGFWPGFWRGPWLCVHPSRCTPLGRLALRMHMNRLALLAIPAAVAFSSTPESMVTVKGITTDCDGAKSAAQPAPRVVVCAFTSVVPRVPQPVLQPSPLQPSQAASASTAFTPPSRWRRWPSPTRLSCSTNPTRKCSNVS